MPSTASGVVIGGTSRLGKEVAKHDARQDREVVISGRDRAPVRANAIHPGSSATAVLGRSAQRRSSASESGTPTGRLVTMQDITAAAVALLENAGINGADLYVDGGWVLL
jgi:NAD(P)-dependent dehydrogenase (short-subunit alcohol dehydrogenase family)